MKLPDNVTASRAKGKVYHYHQVRRGPKASWTPRVRIPYPVEDHRFWLEAERLNGATPEKSGTVASMVADFYASPKWKTLRPVSQRDYERYLDTFTAILGDYLPDQIDAPTIAAFRDHYGTRLSSAKHALSVLKVLFAWAVEQGHTQTNPARDVARPKVKTDGAKPWSQDAIDAALSCDEWRLRLFVSIALYTGQRTADVVQMTLHDFRDGMVRVRSTKTTNEESWIDMHRGLQSIMAEAKAKGAIILFPSRKHGKMKASCLRSAWQRWRVAHPWLEEAHRAGFSPHGLRKSAVVRMREAGVSIEEIMAVTGQSRAIVEHYAKGTDRGVMAARAMKRDW